MRSPTYSGTVIQAKANATIQEVKGRKDVLGGLRFGFMIRHSSQGAARNRHSRHQIPITNNKSPTSHLNITPRLFSTGMLVKFSSLIDSGKKMYFLSYISEPI